MRYAYRTFEFFVEILHTKAADLPKLRKKIEDHYKQPMLTSSTKEEVTFDDWFDDFSERE